MTGEELSGSSRFAGMTLNERLYKAELLSAWDAAAINRDRTTMIELLTKVIDAEFTADDAAKSVDAILAAPAKYGF